ncbi:MAG: trehalose-phosphatase [Acidimicrobiia bacterium]
MTRGRVLLGIDFDGTLAPLVEDPADSVPNERGVELLAALAGRPNITVVVVSGRAHRDLAKRLGPVPGVTLIGEHGNDTGAERPPSPIVADATRFFEVLRGESDAVIETKASSVTFHTRRLTDEEKREAAESIRIWAAEHPETTLLRGKEVLELTVANRTKGDAIRELADTADGVIYIGDDATDETVFAVLHPDDVGIKVGTGPSAARFRVADVSEVVELLEVAALASS